MTGRRLLPSSQTMRAVLGALLICTVVAALGAALGLSLINRMERQAPERLREQAEPIAGELAEAPLQDADGAYLILGTFGIVFAALSVVWLTLVAWRSVRDQRIARQFVLGAAKFEAGDLAHRLPLTGNREWDSLSLTMNRMARRLSERMIAIRNQRIQQSAILESMGGAVIAVDRNLDLLSANRAATTLFGIDPTNRGANIRELLDEPELHAMVEETLSSALREAREFESRVLPGRRLSAITEQMRVNNQKTMGAVVMIDDVTDMRRLESMRSDFAANVSHELRTPITNIQGYVETLQDIDFEDETQIRRFLGIIQRNSERLGLIIEDLLTLARLEQPDDEADADLHPAPLRRIVEEVLERETPAAQQRSIELISTCEETIEVMTRGDLLVEAIGNLVSNAIRYGAEDSVVRIEATTVDDDDLVRIAVTDQGPGIPELHLPRLFERFYRVDKARSRSEGGTGLGLAIVKHIMLVHGGGIEVETSIGAGSTFTLELPGRGLLTPNAGQTSS